MFPLVNPSPMPGVWTVEWQATTPGKNEAKQEQGGRGRKKEEQRGGEEQEEVKSKEEEKRRGREERKQTKKKDKKNLFMQNVFFSANFLFLFLFFPNFYLFRTGDLFFAHKKNTTVFT